ncbi:hypothetical protein KKB83_02755, partial [Patescibacteria group bacterium]|nr:hypothetical protein [Patescibacteria group bacterium]
LSALNILNVATVRTVPLKKAALLILMLIGLILGTSSFYQIAGPLGLLVKWQYRVILFFAFAIAQAMPIFWLVQEEHFCLRWRELIVVALLTMELAAVSAFFPATNFVRAIFISSMLFVLIDLLTKKIKREISNKVIWEHIVLGFFLITFLLSGGG